MAAGEVDGFAVLGEVLHHGRLEQQPAADDVGDREALRGDLQPHEGAHSAGRGGDDDRAGLRPGTGLGADEPEHLEHPQGLPHGGASDLEFGREGALRRQVVARVQDAREQVVLDRIQDDLPGSRAVRGHRGLLVELWSDHSIYPGGAR